MTQTERWNTSQTQALIFPAPCGPSSRADSALCAHCGLPRVMHGTCDTCPSIVKDDEPIDPSGAETTWFTPMREETTSFTPMQVVEQSLAENTPRSY